MLYEDFFYERLAKLRTEKGVSARDMSINLGQNAGYINAIENQHGFPSMTVFFYICEYLGVTPSEFFDPQNEHPMELKELINDLKTLDHDQVQLIASLVKNMKK